jgi:hypothetical protein
MHWSKTYKREEIIEKMRGNKYAVGMTPWNKGKIIGPNPEHSKRMKGIIPWNKGVKRTAHPGNWIEDRSKLKVDKSPWNGPEISEWRLKVRNRDAWKCKMSNKDCKGRLEAHHILPKRDFPELIYDINNGITLCQFHHPRKHKDEKELSPYFQKMVADMN